MSKLNEKDIFTLAQYTDNSQDGVVIALAYEQMTLDQIKNLKAEDVKKASSEFGFSPITLKLINNAINEIWYVDETDNHRFEKSEYIVKDKEGKPVSEEELMKRVQRVLDRSGYSEFSIADIQKSGLVDKK